MDVVLIVLVIAIIIVGLFFKDFKSVVYFIGIVDIFFRLLHKLITLINVKVITDFVVAYIPSSVEAIINNYSTGILNTVLIWVLFLLYCYFEFYLIKYWLKKKK
jgi:hypothetical protein